MSRRKPTATSSTSNGERVLTIKSQLEKQKEETAQLASGGVSLKSLKGKDFVFLTQSEDASTLMLSLDADEAISSVVQIAPERHRVVLGIQADDAVSCNSALPTVVVSDKSVLNSLYRMRALQSKKSGVGKGSSYLVDSYYVKHRDALSAYAVEGAAFDVMIKDPATGRSTIIAILVADKLVTIVPKTLQTKSTLADKVSNLFLEESKMLAYAVSAQEVSEGQAKGLSEEERSIRGQESAEKYMLKADSSVRKNLCLSLNAGNLICGLTGSGKTFASYMMAYQFATSDLTDTHGTNKKSILYIRNFESRGQAKGVDKFSSILEKADALVDLTIFDTPSLPATWLQAIVNAHCTESDIQYLVLVDAVSEYLNASPFPGFVHTTFSTGVTAALPANIKRLDEIANDNVTILATFQYSAESILWWWSTANAIGNCLYVNRSHIVSGFRNRMLDRQIEPPELDKKISGQFFNTHFRT